MMLFLPIIVAFIAGISVGYAIFSCSPKDFNYVLRLNGKKIECKFRSVKTELWDDCDGCGKAKYEYVELVEK